MRTLKVRDLEIGNGIPKICVPIVAANQTEAFEQADRIMRSPADVIEWRADFFNENLNKKTIGSFLKRLNKNLNGRLLLFTFRTAAEGGERAIEESEYSAICRRIINTGAIDLIDIEYSMSWNTVRHLTTYAQQRGVYVISSSHYFTKTPSESEMKEKLYAMKKSGADMIKLAVMPYSLEDVYALQNVTLEMFKKDANSDIDGVPIVAISMGTLGIASRITCEIFGSAMTFASVERSSAPGQIDADIVDNILIDVHRQITDGKYAHKMKGSLDQSENIVLIGFMGTGKSMVSRILERSTGRKSIEIDEAVERAEGMKVSEIFHLKGEAYFRDAETKQTMIAAAEKNVIISCGGGTVLRKKNLEALRSSGKIILLRAKPETVYDRVKHSGNKRPLLARYMSRGHISWLMKKREELYMEAADIVINVDGYRSADIAEKIKNMIRSGQDAR